MSTVYKVVMSPNGGSRLIKNELPYLKLANAIFDCCENYCKDAFANRPWSVRLYEITESHDGDNVQSVKTITKNCIRYSKNKDW